MLKSNLSKILGERRLTRTKFGEMAGLAPCTVKSLYDDTWTSIDRSTIDRVCQTLEIPINEFLEAVPNTPISPKRERRRVRINEYKKKGNKMQVYPEEKERIYSSPEDNILDSCHKDSGNENLG